MLFPTLAKINRNLYIMIYTEKFCNILLIASLYLQYAKQVAKHYNDRSQYNTGKNCRNPLVISMHSYHCSNTELGKRIFMFQNVKNSPVRVRRVLSPPPPLYSFEVLQLQELYCGFGALFFLFLFFFFSFLSFVRSIMHYAAPEARHGAKCTITAQ